MEDQYLRNIVSEPPLENLEMKSNTSSSLIEGNTSFVKTIFNGANAILGNGVLVVPYALSSGGWLSLVAFFTICILSTYTGLLLKKSMEVDPRIKRYSDIGEQAFGKKGKVIVSIVLYADLFMATTGFLILEGDNLHKLFPKVVIHALGITLDGKSSFILIVALILFPSVLLNNLSIFAYISVTGCLSALLILGSVLWVGASKSVGFHHAQSSTILNWKGMPTSISLYMLCYTSHPIFPTLYTSMQKKPHFFKALLFSFAFSTFIYGSMGILGYLMFGSTVESQITLNLPSQSAGSKIAIYTTVITPLVKYALLLKPVAIMTEGWFPGKYKKNKIFITVIRLLLVATQVVIALALPFFGSLMSLAGALLGATGSLTIPCLCYLKISRIRSSERPIVECYFICVVICLGVFITVSGTYTSLVHLVKEIMQTKK